jgi:hypothetical protein
MMQAVNVELNRRFGKAAFTMKKTFFISKLGLNVRKRLVKYYTWNITCLVLKLGHFVEQRNTLKVLKCGAGSGWRRSV